MRKLLDVPERSARAGRDGTTARRPGIGIQRTCFPRSAAPDGCYPDPAAKDNCFPGTRADPVERT